MLLRRKPKPPYKQIKKPLHETHPSIKQLVYGKLKTGYIRDLSGGPKVKMAWGNHTVTFSDGENHHTVPILRLRQAIQNGGLELVPHYLSLWKKHPYWYMWELKFQRRRSVIFDLNELLWYVRVM